MGNNPSTAALAAINPKGALNNAAKDLGIGESPEETAAKAKQKELEGAANRHAQELRQEERATDYQRKTAERNVRKAKLQEKWKQSHETNS